MIKTSDIKDFDIICVSSKNFLGEAIQEFTDSKINHTGIFVWLEGILYISEAEKHGLQLVPFSEYPKTSKYKTFFVAKPTFNISKEQKTELKHFILKQTRRHRYDFLSLLLWQPIKQITRKLFKHPVWLGDRSIDASRRFTCSEWVAFVYYFFFDKFPKWYLTDPNEIFTNKNFIIDKTEIQPK